MSAPVEDRLRAIHAELGALKAENFELKTENTALKTENTNLQTEKNNLRTENANVINENNTLRAAREQDQATIANLRHQIAKARKDINKYRKETLRLEAVIEKQRQAAEQGDSERVAALEESKKFRQRKTAYYRGKAEKSVPLARKAQQELEEKQMADELAHRMVLTE